MKVLRQLCAVAVLTIVLAQATLADDGVIHPGITPPPPPPPTGVIHPGLADPCVEELICEETEDDLMTEMTLILARNLLALF
ncbi:MAG: hypothetical protein QOG71_3801 [Pyrinomonadaceae bacterium]|nr:hypothetical protein [Pyrinomonadaceae bacterium]